MTLDFYIEKFEAIPADKWCVNHFTDPTDQSKHCALGHCGERLRQPPREHQSVFTESDGLKSICRHIRDVNDGTFGYENYEKDPKSRVLKMLKSLKLNRIN